MKKKGRSDEVNWLIFQKFAKDPMFWFGNAESFERAARVLLNQMNEDEKTSTRDHPLGGTYTLLMGLAIENELKAILMALDPEKFVTEHRNKNNEIDYYRLDKDFASHRLQKLAEKACTILLNKDKITTLELLEFAIVGGKYDMGISSRDYDKIDQLDLVGITGGKGGHGPKYKLTPLGDIDKSSGDIAAFNELFDIFKNKYRSLLSLASD